MENSLVYVNNILKRFGIIVYTGSRLDDIALMELEIKDLYEYKLISDEEYLKAIKILTKN